MRSSSPALRDQDSGFIIQEAEVRSREFRSRRASGSIRLAEWYSTPRGIHEGSGETSLPGGGSGLALLLPGPAPQLP